MLAPGNGAAGAGVTLELSPMALSSTLQSASPGLQREAFLRWSRKPFPPGEWSFN